MCMRFSISLTTLDQNTVKAKWFLHNLLSWFSIVSTPIGRSSFISLVIEDESSIKRWAILNCLLLYQKQTIFLTVWKFLSDSQLVCLARQFVGRRDKQHQVPSGNKNKIFSLRVLTFIDSISMTTVYHMRLWIVGSGVWGLGFGWLVVRN